MLCSSNLEENKSIYLSISILKYFKAFTLYWKNAQEKKRTF